MRFAFLDLAVRIDDSELAVLILIGCFVALICIIVPIVAAGYNMHKDDNEEEVIYEGVVLETKIFEDDGLAKDSELRAEWIIFETRDKQRHRFRNVRPRQLFLQPGDVGTLIIRGSTIYGFNRVGTEK